MPNKINAKIDINIVEPLWKTHPRISQKIKSLFIKIIPQTPLQKIIHTKAIRELGISILLTNDQQIRELNQYYRKQDKPTNVLSFPLLDCQKIKNGDFKNLDLTNKNLALGDIVISYQTIFKEAIEQNKTFENHLTHMITHSLLHLIGFDHIKKQDAKIMEELEIKILTGVDIKNPYWDCCNAK